MSPSRAESTHANTVCRHLGILVTHMALISRTEVEGIAVRVHRQNETVKVFTGQCGHDAAAGGAHIPSSFKVY